MTKQEAIGKIEYIIDNGQDYGYWTDAQKKALYMAIKALEAEPSEDCISRDWVLNKIHAYAEADTTSTGASVGADYCAEFVENAPSVVPKRDEWEKVPYKKQGHDEIVIDDEAWCRTNCGSAKKKNEPQMNQ